MSDLQLKIDFMEYYGMYFLLNVYGILWHTSKLLHVQTSSLFFSA